jgi:hypothetical protein
LSLGTYHIAKIPKASPATQVQIHQRSPAGRLPRTMSRTTSATAHPAVMTLMTSWSSASSGGGGEGRSARSEVSFIPPGYEVVARARTRPAETPSGLRPSADSPARMAAAGRLA